MINRFPLDRVNNFCDAVFAIAMTLLILEIRLPAADDISNIGTLGVLRRLIPSFIGFLVSFFVTALYWRAHLTLMQYVKSIDNRLLWLTIWLLLFVVLMPFSTALYSKNFNFNGPFIFYCLNLVIIGGIQFMMVNAVARNGALNESLPHDLVKRLRFRALSAAIIWAFSAAWVFVEPYSARFLFILIFIVQVIGEKGRTKQQAPSAGDPV